MGHKDLRLGQIVYILVFCNMSFSRLLPLDGFQFIFLLRDSENDLLPLTVFCVRLGRAYGGVRLIRSHPRFFARDWEEPSEVLGSLPRTEKFTLTVFRAMCAAILSLKL